jgi:hypothetical protein
MLGPDIAPAVQQHPGARHQEVTLMQKERSTRRRVRIADNLYERPGRTKAETRYMVGYADANGVWRMKTLQATTRTDARAERDAFLAKLRRGEIAPPSKLTFAEVATEFLTAFEGLVASGERAERTLERYRSALDLHVIPTLGQRQIQKITADQLAALISSRRVSGRGTSALAPWTVRGIITPIRRVFALAARRGYIAENPVLRLHPDELPRGRAAERAAGSNGGRGPEAARRVSEAVSPVACHRSVHRHEDPGDLGARLE